MIPKTTKAVLARFFNTLVVFFSVYEAEEGELSPNADAVREREAADGEAAGALRSGGSSRLKPRRLIVSVKVKVVVCFSAFLFLLFHNNLNTFPVSNCKELLFFSKLVLHYLNNAKINTPKKNNVNGSCLLVAKKNWLF